MVRTCVILQPSYVPWRGVFDQIRQADVFVHYDDVQYTRGGWRNRNRIKGLNGSFWITIPVALPGGKMGTRLDETLISYQRNWQKSHWASIRGSYGRAPHFDALATWLRPFFAQAPDRLIDFTIPLQEACALALGLTDTEFIRASSLNVGGERSARLVEICRQVGADHYLSGPSAREYLDERLFEAAHISVEYVGYNHAPYPQLYGDFESQVSILDTLAMLGPNAAEAIAPLNE